MSGRIVKEVFEYAPEDLTHLELNVLASLAESARDTTRIATHETTRDALAYRCRTTPATIKNVLRTLRDRGLVTPINGVAHRGKATHYEIARLTPAHRDATWKRGITG